MVSTRLTVPLVAAAMGSALILSGCAQGTVSPNVGDGAAGEKRQLIGPEITSTLSGKRYAWFRARDHATGETLFGADGTMTWKRTDTISSGRGRWAVDGDNLCQTYDPTPQWKGGRVCRQLYVEGAKLVTSPNDGGLVSYTEVPAT